MNSSKIMSHNSLAALREGKSTYKLHLLYMQANYTNWDIFILIQPNNESFHQYHHR